MAPSNCNAALLQIARNWTEAPVCSNFETGHSRVTRKGFRISQVWSHPAAEQHVTGRHAATAQYHISRTNAAERIVRQTGGQSTVNTERETKGTKQATRDRETTEQEVAGNGARNTEGETAGTRSSSRHGTSQRSLWMVPEKGRLRTLVVQRSR